MVIDPSLISPVERQSLLNTLIAPRPIALVSTVDCKGKANLAPYSFFGVFSINPPVVIFSTVNRLRDGSLKNTLENVMEIPEAVIHIVEQEQLKQVNLCSSEFPRGVDEFDKAGFTAEPAGLVRPPMVKECRMKMECRVTDIRALGHEPGAGNLVICEVVRLHIADSVLTGHKLELADIHYVARLGGSIYCRVGPENMFEMEKPKGKIIGFDNLPPSVRQSTVLTGHHQLMLASVQDIPGLRDASFDAVQRLVSTRPEDSEATRVLHEQVKQLLDNGKVDSAWKLLLSDSE